MRRKYLYAQQTKKLLKNPEIRKEILENMRLTSLVSRQEKKENKEKEIKAIRKLCNTLDKLMKKYGE